MRSIALTATLLAAVAAGAADKRPVMLPDASPDLPFSNAVWTGDFLYTAGTLGSVPGEGYPAGIEAQTRQAFLNLERILKAAGVDLTRVVSASVYLADDRLYEGMNSVFREVFPENAPTRATVRTDLAARDGLVEISLVAVRPGVELRRIDPPGWRPSTQGFAHAILAGDTLFVSGLVASRPENGSLVTGDIGVQTRQVLENLGAVLRAAGMTPGDVVTNRVYLRDGRDFQGMNEAYRETFSEAPPARATVRAGIMHEDLRLEIQSVAVKDASRRIVPEASAGSVLSPSVVASSRQFLSGMTGRGASGYAPGDVRAQTREAIARLKSTLEAAGLGLGDVVETTVFLADIRHFSAMNEVYRELVPSPRPSRTTVGTALMSPDALVEIQMIADAEK